MGERIRTLVDGDWKFHKGDIDGAEAREFNDASWQAVDLPHDFSIEGPFDKKNEMNSGYLPKGIGWYRKCLAVDREMRDRRICIEFEGVYRNSTVWVNGEKVGSHIYGYTGFVFDITSYLRFDGKPNTIAVKIDNPAQGDESKRNIEKYWRGMEGWWYEGCGIYRHVWLTTTNHLHVEPWGTFVTTPEVSEQRAVVNVRTNVCNDSPVDEQCTLETDIIDPSGRVVITLSSEARIPAGADWEFNQQTGIKNPSLWSLDAPNLYTARSVIIASGSTPSPQPSPARGEGDILDDCTTTFGIRWFEFTSDKGFFLNGKHMQIRGMCNHADCGGLGMALPDRVNEKTIEIMKAMGCNILRSAHHDAAPALMDICDRLGMLVWAETRYLDTADVAIPPLRELIHRNRNHPSIICWSLANTAGSPDGEKTEQLKALNNVAHAEDPYRPTAFGCEANTDANANGFAFVTDIMGYNGGGMGIDDRDHELYPERKMLVTEFSSGRGARGIYKEEPSDTETYFTFGDGRTMKFNGKYTSVYDLCRQFEKEWTHIAERPWLAGGIMWSGFEYYGETCGWPTVTSQFGVLDICKFPKDTYYYFLQEWTTEPMVHIFPHWTWPGREGEIIDVWCYSNCESVELLLNGESLGFEPARPLSHIEWRVPYKPGVLIAKGMKDGQVICTQEIRTAGAAAKLSVSPDRDILKADGQDVSFVTVSVTDAAGNLVPNAANKINIEVTGSGKLIGLSAGDPRGHEDVKGDSMSAFSGLLLAIVQSTGETGEIRVNATSEGLSAGNISLRSA